MKTRASGSQYPSDLMMGRNVQLGRRCAATLQCALLLATAQAWLEPARAQMPEGEVVSWCYSVGGTDGGVELYPSIPKRRATLLNAMPVAAHAPSSHRLIPLAIDWFELDQWTTAKGGLLMNFHGRAIYRFVYTHKAPGPTRTQTGPYYEVLLAWSDGSGAKTTGLKPFFIASQMNAVDVTVAPAAGNPAALEIRGSVPAQANAAAVWTMTWAATGPRLQSARFSGSGLPMVTCHYDGKDKSLLVKYDDYDE